MLSSLNENRPILSKLLRERMINSLGLFSLFGGWKGGGGGKEGELASRKDIVDVTYCH